MSYFPRLYSVSLVVYVYLCSIFKIVDWHNNMNLSKVELSHWKKTDCQLWEISIFKRAPLTIKIY